MNYRIHGHSIDELVSFGADREQVIAAFKTVAQDERLAVGITAKPQEFDYEKNEYVKGHAGRLEGCRFFILKKVYNRATDRVEYALRSEDMPESLSERLQMQEDSRYYTLHYDHFDCKYILKEAGIKYYS